MTVLDVGDQHTGPSPSPPNRPGCVICQQPCGPGSDWCPTHLGELRHPRPETTGNATIHHNQPTEGDQP